MRKIIKSNNNKSRFYFLFIPFHYFVPDPIFRRDDYLNLKRASTILIFIRPNRCVLDLKATIRICYKYKNKYSHFLKDV